MALSVQIGSFVTRVGTEIKTIKSHLGDIAQLTTTATSSLVAAVNELKTAVGKNTADIATINGTLTTHGSDIAQLKTDVQTNSGAITTLEGRITTNEGNISTQGGKITTIEGQITTINSDIDAVEKAIEDLEGIVAAQTNIDDANVATTTTYSSSKIVSEITAAKQAVKDDLLGGAGTAYDTLKELADLISTNASSIEALEALAAGHVKFDGAQELSDTQKSQARTNIGAASAADLTTLTGRVTTVEGVAAQNKTDIAALAVAVGDTNTDYVAMFEAALA
jgi:chromosome segregation ATPase